MGATEFKVLGKGKGITEAMEKDLLSACQAAAKSSEDGNDRCTYITKYVKEKYGGTWQSVMIPYGPGLCRGGSVKWIEDMHIYIQYEPGKFQTWIWKTNP